MIARPLSLLPVLRRRSIASAIAALLATLFVASQAGSLAHQIAVRHARCAEHGELIDVHEAGARTLARATPTDRSTRVAAAGDEGRDHRHDHCVLAHAQRNFAAGGPQNASSATRAPLSLPLPTLASFIAPRDRARYRLAPKTSPPA